MHPRPPPGPECARGKPSKARGPAQQGSTYSEETSMPRGMRWQLEPMFSAGFDVSSKSGVANSLMCLLKRVLRFMYELAGARTQSVAFRVRLRPSDIRIYAQSLRLNVGVSLF